MSRKGCSSDNAACEGFFGRLKNEMFYNQSWKGVRLKEFIKRLDEYLDWYRAEQIKLSLGGISLVQHRLKQGLSVNF